MMPTLGPKVLKDLLLGPLCYLEPQGLRKNGQFSRELFVGSKVFGICPELPKILHERSICLKPYRDS